MFAAGARQTGELSLEPLVGIRPETPGSALLPRPQHRQPLCPPTGGGREAWTVGRPRCPSSSPRLRAARGKDISRRAPRPCVVFPSRRPFPAPRRRVRFPSGSPAFRTTPAATCALPRPAPSPWAAAVATARTRHPKEGCPPGHAGTLPQDQRLGDVWPR